MKLTGNTIKLKSRNIALELDNDLTDEDEDAFEKWLTTTGLTGIIELSQVDVSVFYEDYYVPIIVIPRNRKKLVTLCKLKWS